MKIRNPPWKSKKSLWKPEGSEARECSVSLVVVHGDPAVGLTLLLTLQADGEGHAHRMTEIKKIGIGLLETKMSWEKEKQERTEQKEDWRACNSLQQKMQNKNKK